MTNEQSHKKLIRELLLRGDSITALEALRDFGCYRLASRISDLRNEGLEIKKVMEESISRITGKPVRFARYSIDNANAMPKANRGLNN